MSFDPVDFSLIDAAKGWLVVICGIVGIVLVLSLMTAALGGGQLGFLRALGSKLTGKRYEGQPWAEVKQAFGGVFRALGVGFADLFQTSPRRVWALAMLTFKESTRRKTLLVFVIFALLFMFGGWFLSDANSRADLQVKVYVSFVLTAISWLTLPVVLLMSCWGLPNDIKQRTLHTVVTKPVRRNEIILGRMLGFTCVSTLLLGVMGGVGYFWIVRQIPSSARSNLICRVPVYGALSFLDREGKPGTGVNVGDIWEFREYIEGATRARAIWEFRDVTPSVLVDRPVNANGEPVKRLLLESGFEAFRTHKGDLNRGTLCEIHLVRNIRGQAARALAGSPGFGRVGALIGVGDFQAAADALTQISDAFRKSSDPTLPVKDSQQIDASFRDFTALLRPIIQNHAGEAWINNLAQASDQCADAAKAANREQLAQSLGDLSALFSKNADGLKQLIVDIRVPLPVFDVKEFKLNVIEIDPAGLNFTAEDEQTGRSTQRKVDLFKDLVQNGRLRVEARCVDSGQYLGMARPDLFIRSPDRPFWSGYSKSIFCIWLMLELVVVLGVTAGSLLNGPVSTFLVFGLMIVGQGFREFLVKITQGQIQGSGTFESIIRIVNHMNPTSPLDDGMLTDIVFAVDRGIGHLMWLAAQVIPNFSHFARILQFLPNGFDVDWARTLLPAIAVTVGYLLPGVIIGYYCLKMRELEQK